MATSVTLPALGASVTEGTVTRWLKQPGDEVAVDEPLPEVSTDKVDTEIPSPVAGTLLEIKVAEDETVEVGAELAVIGEASEAGGESGTDAGAAADDGSAGEQQPAAPEAAASEAAQSEAQAAESEPAAPAPAPSSGDAAGTPVTLPA